MSAAAELSGARVCLRAWRDEDREAFATMNADARVMEFFRTPLTRNESDAFVDRIQKHFAELGFGLWAIEVPNTVPFIGICGLSIARFNVPFTPCIEVGWRLAFEHWGRGFATEAAKLAVAHAFSELALREIVSFTSVRNLRSRAVMERLGMRYNPADDFDHPGLPPAHPLCRQVLYRLRNGGEQLGS
ncbi:MAG: GNAT family N-acetyltransferase [Hyphomicrobiaceae bacterium]